MISAELHRLSRDDKQTLGVLAIGTMSWKTMELGWFNNANDISCIPPGRYTCKWTRSNRLSKLKGEDVFTYELQNVPSRDGIRVHSANFFFSLRGCLALGKDFVDINQDGYNDLVSSKIAIKEFNDFLNKQDFELTIYDVPVV